MSVRGGVRPMINYEDAARSTAPSQRDRMRKTMLLGVQSAGFRPCSVTAFDWRLGIRIVPWVAEPLRQILLFLRL